MNIDTARAFGLTLMAASVGLFFVGSIAQPAAGEDLDVPLAGYVSGPPGSLVRVAYVEVDEAAVQTAGGEADAEKNARCRVSVETDNGASINPGNDLILSSGNSVVTFYGVEDERDKHAQLSEIMTLGDTVSAHLRFGPRGAASMDFSLSFQCQPTEVTADPKIVATNTGSDNDPASNPDVDPVVDPAPTPDAAQANGPEPTTNSGAVENPDPVDNNPTGDAATPTAAANATPATTANTTQTTTPTELQETPVAKAQVADPTYTG